MGRFTTANPLMASDKVWDPQTWNRYAYTLNDPLKYVDPTGMKEVTAEQCAKDEYGNANIHLEVTYTAGAVTTENGKLFVSSSSSISEFGRRAMR